MNFNSLLHIVAVPLGFPVSSLLLFRVLNDDSRERVRRRSWSAFFLDVAGVEKPSHLREDLNRIRDVEEGIQSIYLSQKFRIFSVRKTAALTLGSWDLFFPFSVVPKAEL